MNILLDTHIILWYFDGSDKLKKDWIKMIDSSENNIFYSSISTAEICLKHSIGKLELPINFFEVFLKVDWDELSFDSKDSKILFSLPLLHKDPFDRMLISQSISNNFYLMTSDENIRKYDLKLTI